MPLAEDCVAVQPCPLPERYDSLALLVPRNPPEIANVRAVAASFGSLVSGQRTVAVFDPVADTSTMVEGSRSPAGPWAPVAPVSPFAPGAPVAPVSPFAPGAPVAPVSPFAPGAPVAPVSPFAPSSPGAPVWPVSPFAPGSPGAPASPVSPFAP